jgi:ArsR family transcriptional regulator
MDKNIPGQEELNELAELFKVFSDLTRINILISMNSGEKTVSAISLDVGMSPSAVSHQLKLLKTSSLVKSRREGKNIYYSLADDHVKTIISVGLDHVEEKF